ncbi:biorientation of chromosomes in cell division protein 1-like 1 isoform X1 [Rhopalosiphum padi]|uniref:biorientation of chromosomes in cell division protein 1-like 1 isoform X1 n=2 Tax=Rhopalosiphum padi TaxID=40932 RepID=UPI00298E3D94|nr:biorientation of chromosomes in cell division protein 1-like 1 isoform X1 [Rhopalosiphum padi]XP_060834855.1 biorientation of chromosomes in cell division protein 1-like 1 isoform X1 [Rhopalosiphum padi]
MERKNDMLGFDDIVFMLLETLKSNGTFDEIRRHCVTDIDAKPTYQNWKQRIESNVNKFLSKLKYTPELNKTTVREQLRKHLLDGHEIQDIEEGADRILIQILAPRTLSIFEPKISVAVDEYLGIKNDAPPIELNSFKESSMDSINVSNIENSTVFHPKIGADNIPCDKTQKDDRKDLRSYKKEKSSSLCKEPKLLNSNRTDDENDTGRSLKQKSSQLIDKTSASYKSKSSTNHKSNKKDNSCKEVVNKSKKVANKSKGVSKFKDIVDKFKDISKPKDIFDKFKDISKAKDVIDKSKDISKPKDIVEKSKDIINKAKDVIDKSKDISKPKDIVNKAKDMVDKSKDKSFLSTNSNSNSSSHKSNQTDTKRTKRSLEDKKKLSSLCKEPKLLNNNQSDDESNAGGSSKQKSTLHKNKSSLSDKTKSSSSNHNNSRKDNTSTDVVDKSKDKSLSKNSIKTVDKFKNKSLSKNTGSSTITDKSKDKSSSKISSSIDINNSKNKSLTKYSTCSIHKSNHNDSKRLKVSQPAKKKLPINNKNVEKNKSEKPEWNDFQSSDITNDEQDAANVLLSMSSISYESSHGKIITENSSPISKTLKMPKIENVDQKKILPSSNNDNIKDNSRLKSKNLKTSQLQNTVKSVSSPVGHLFEKVCSVDIESNEVSVPVIDNVSINIMCEKLEQKSNNDTDIKINDSANTLSKQILHEKIENNSVKVLDDDKSHYSFKGFSEAETIPCKNYKLLKNVINTLQVKINNHDVIIDGFKGFNSVETHPCKHRDIVYAELIKLKDSKSSSDFIGFSEEDAQLSIGHKYVIQQLELAKKQNNVDNHQENVKFGRNGIQNGNTFNEVMAEYLYKSNNDNVTTSKEIYSKPINDTKKDCPTVNNNHNHDNWVLQQEMKYKLLPVKVKLERLMDYRCNNAKRVSDSSQVPI